MTGGPASDRPGDADRPGLLDALLLPDAPAAPSGSDAGQPRGGALWARRVGALLFWGSVQGVFLFVPPLVGIVVNLAIAAGFVWWFVRRPIARREWRRVSTFRLRPIARPARRWLPLAAAAQVAVVFSSLVVLPRFVRMPTDRVEALEAYLRRPFGVVAVLLTVALLAPLLEEFLFRGWLQRTLERSRALGARYAGATPWGAILTTALVFALVHFEAFGFPVRTAFGVAAGYVAWATRSIWPSVVMHSAYNASLILVGGSIPDLDERTLTTWARTDAIFWPVLAGLVGASALLAWTLRAMRRATWRDARGATPRARPVG